MSAINGEITRVTQGWQLVAPRLASASGKHGQGHAVVDERLDDLALVFHTTRVLDRARGLDSDS